MALFGFGKKKEAGSPASQKLFSRANASTQAPKVITRSSALGTIIDLEYKQELPRDAKWLFITGLAYWRGAFGPNLKANMDVCRRLAVKAFYAIYQYGLQNEYPEAGFLMAMYFFRHDEEKYGEPIDYKPCVAHMCHYYIMNGPEANFLQEPIMLFLKHHPDGMEQVILWLKDRVMRDKKQGAEPVGLIMLRHYLVLRLLAVETKFPYDPAPYDYFAKKYQLSEAVVQCVSGRLLYKQIYEHDDITVEDRERLKEEAWNGNLVAAQIVYGIGIDKIPYCYDGMKADSDGNVFSYKVTQYRQYYEKWTRALPGLQQEQAVLSGDWFQKEESKAEQKVKQAKKGFQKKQSVAEEYARALYMHACRRIDESLTLMKQVEAADASKIRVADWKNGKRKNEAEMLAEELFRKPNISGYRQLAKLMGRYTPYWEPLTDLSLQIRRDLLAVQGTDGLAMYLLDEPDEDCLRYAQGLIYDPEVNGGDLERVKAGWLALALRHYQKGEDDLTEAIEYVNRYFACPNEFKKHGLDIKYVTKLAAENDEKALHVLGELYVDFEEVNGGDELLIQLGQLFYRRLSRLYKKRFETIEDQVEKMKFLLEWYQFELVDRREEDSKLVDEICIKGIRMNIPHIYHTMARKNVYDHFMDMEGRIWIKACLGAALESGYKNVAELYNKMDLEDREREAEIRREETYRRKKQEEEWARDRERRRQAFNERCDDMERMWDMMNGGTGMTSEEQMFAGRKSAWDHMRDQDLRNSIPEWLW